MSGVPAKLIVDVDVGTDDYLALLILFFAESLLQVKILALICSNGNTTPEYNCKNLVRLLEVVNRTDIPVYRGANNQFLPPTEEMEHFFGIDGFGGVPFDPEPDMTILQKDPAAVGLGRIVLDNPNEITILSVAGLTDLALATRMYDTFADTVKEIWIMGGNYNAVGNSTDSSEFNFYVDPEAAAIVTGSMTCPIYILSKEATIPAEIPIDWVWNVFGSKTSPEIELLLEAERNVYGDIPMWRPSDAMLAASFIQPEAIITATSVHKAAIELHSWWTRGQMVLDRTNEKIWNNNVTIIKGINKEAFQDLLMKL